MNSVTHLTNFDAVDWASVGKDFASAAFDLASSMSWATQDEFEKEYWNSISSQAQKALLGN